MHRLTGYSERLGQVATTGLHHVPQQSAKTFKLWLMAPAFANGKCAPERDKHARARQCDHGCRKVTHAATGRDQWSAVGACVKGQIAVSPTCSTRCGS
jgi:hypothetical protein